MLNASTAGAALPGEPGRIAYNAQDVGGACLPVLRLVAPDGSDPGTAAVAGLQAKWAADGTTVAYVGDDGSLYVAAADGSDTRSVAYGSEPSWSPDGHSITFVCNQVTFPGGDVCTVDLDSGEVTNLTNDTHLGDPVTRYSRSPTWAPDGTRIAFYRYVDERQPSGAIHRTTGIWSIASDGDEPAPLAIVDGIVSGPFGTNAIDGYDYLGPDWSPDGTRLALQRVERIYPGAPASAANTRRSIATIAADGSDLRHVSPATDANEADSLPAWSPDGTLIAFRSDHDDSAGPDHLWVVAADGTNAHQVSADRVCGTPSWEVLPQPLIVNSGHDTGDQNAGDGKCATGDTVANGDPECTLSAAIEEANAHPGKDTIAFDIPGTGVPDIHNGASEFVVTDPVVIDGTTQPVAGKVEIAAGAQNLPDICQYGPGSPGWRNAFVVRGGRSRLRGLVINGFCGYAIVLTEGGGNVVEGNFIGTDPTGTKAVPNGYATLDHPSSTGGGILVESADNRIGGLDHDPGVCAASCNLVAGNALKFYSSDPEGPIYDAKNVAISGPLARGNVVAGNFIGVDLGGSRQPSGNPYQWWGLVIQRGATENTIESNVMAANGLTQVFVDATSDRNAIVGNRIGTAASGMTRVAHEDAQGAGVVVASGNDVVSGNVIGGFYGLGHGVWITGQENLVSDNRIGLAANGTGDLASGYGITLQDAADTVVQDNVVAFGNEAAIRVVDGAAGTLIFGNELRNSGRGIAFEGAADAFVVDNAIHHDEVGVAVSAAKGPVRIWANAIYDNAPALFGLSGLGIDLAPSGVTPNDFGDADGITNFPVLGFAAITNSGRLRVGGSLETGAGVHAYRVELFANAACDESGYGEGERYLGATEVATDGTGRAVIDVTLTEILVADGESVTATATDAAGHTSELSRCVEASYGTGVAERALPGATTITVTNASGLAIGDRVAICPGCPTEEVNVIAGFGSLHLAAPLAFAHETGEAIVKVPTTLDPFTTYATTTAKGMPSFVPIGPVTLADRFGTRDYDVLKLGLLATPADTNQAGTLDAATQLLDYALKPRKGSAAFAKHRDVRVITPCNDTFVRVKKPTSFRVPAALAETGAATAPDPAAHERDHFLCYTAAAETKLGDGTPVPKPPRGMQVDVADRFETRRYDLKAITRLCQPVAKSGAPHVLKGANAGTPVALAPAAIRHPFDHLLCYRAKLATRTIAQSGCAPIDPKDRGAAIVPKQPKHVPHRDLSVASQLGALRLDTKKELELCLPATSPDPGVE